MTVADDHGEGVSTVVILARCVGVFAGGRVQHQGAVGRFGARLQGEAEAVLIDIGGSNLAADRSVFGSGLGLVRSLRCIVNRSDVEIDDRLDRAAFAVAHHHGEGVSTVVILARGVGVFAGGRVQHQGAVSRLGARFQGEGEAVLIDVGAHDLAADRGVFGGGPGLVGTDRRIVRRADVAEVQLRGIAQPAVTDGIGRARHRAVVVRRRGEGEAAIRVDHQRANATEGGGLAGGIALAVEGEAGDGQRIAVRVAVVGQHIAGGRGVFGHGDRAVVCGNRRIVHRVHAYGDGDGVAAALAVIDHHGEAVAAVEVLPGGVGVGAVGVDHHGAVARGVAQVEAQRVAVRVVGAQAAADRGVFIGANAGVLATRVVVRSALVLRVVALFLLLPADGLAIVCRAEADVRVDPAARLAKHHEAVAAARGAGAPGGRRRTGRGGRQGLGRVEAGGDGFLQVLGARYGELCLRMCRCRVRQAGAAPLAVAPQVDHATVAGVQGHGTGGARDQLLTLVDAVTFDQDALGAFGGYRNHLADDAFDDGDDVAHALLLMRLTWCASWPAVFHVGARGIPLSFRAK